MDLKTFVSDSLVGIIEGVQDARERTAEKGHAAITPKLSNGYGETKAVSFDIAVSLSEKTGKDGVFEIAVMSLKAGLGRDKETTSDVVSRIRFDVDIAFKS